MSNTLKDKLEQIQTEKTTKLIPQNIKKDVEILGVTGTLQPLELNIYAQGPDGDGTWTLGNKANYPYSTSGTSFALVGTNIYGFGGSTNNYRNKVYKYDTLTDTYTALNNFPTNISGAVITSIGTDIYLFGGFNGSSYMTSAYKYDTLTDTTTQLTSTPSYDSYSGSAVAFGTDIYLFGILVRGSVYSTANHAYKYDTLTDTYTALNDMPFSGSNSAACIIGTDVYLITYSTSASKIYKYNIAEDTYTQMATAPYGFIGEQINLIGTDMYLFSWRSSSQQSNWVYKYNTITNEFTRLNDTSVTFYGKVVVNDIIYGFGDTADKYRVSTFTLNTGEPTDKNGLWLKSNLTPSEIITDDTVTLDPYWDTEKIAELKTIPYSFYHGSTVIIDTNVYLFGGEGDNTTVYKYNTLTDTYTQLTNIPYNFWYGGAVAVGTDIYLFGSVYNSGGSFPYSQRCYKYDTLTDTYTQLTNIPYPFFSGGAVAIGTDIYLFGSNYPAGGNYSYSQRCCKYDTLTDTYTQLTNIPYNFWYGSVILVGTDIYLFGGGTSSTKTTAYKYDTLTDTYTQLTNIPYEFYDGSVVNVGMDIYLFGSANSSYNTTAYKYNILTDTYTQLTNIPYSFTGGSAIFIGIDIYLFGGQNYPTKVQVFTFPTKNYTNNSIVIEKGSNYETDLISTNVTNGLPYKFKNFYYYTTTGGLDDTIEKYYGNGTNWIQIT